MSKPMSKTKRAIDRYDLEIEDIKLEIDEARGWNTENDIIENHWDSPRLYGGLFSYCTPDRQGNGVCGCLTQIKGFPELYKSPDPKLTKKILSSTLPKSAAELELRHLHQFARWQRKMDAMWPGRGKMQMPEGFEERLRKANS